jgi:hypothetical protein
MKPRHPIAGIESHEARVRELNRAWTRAVAAITAVALLLIGGLTLYAGAITP